MKLKALTLRNFKGIRDFHLEPDGTVWEYKGKTYFQINEMELLADDVWTILHGSYGYSRNMALSRLAKALEVALDKEQQAALENME